MIPLPKPLGSGDLTLWRLDDARFASVWNSGEGSFRVGGRWNSVGVRAVYASLDPATAILEVAVHKTFSVLDTVPHVLTRARISDPAMVHIVRPEDVPNTDWLVPTLPGAGQQAFGDALLQKHRFVLIPSAVSRHSWNVLFVDEWAKGHYDKVEQERFALDTRLNPPRV